MCQQLELYMYIYIYTHIYIHIYTYICIYSGLQGQRFKVPCFTHCRTLTLTHAFVAVWADMDIINGFERWFCSGLHVSDVWEQLWEPRMQNISRVRQKTQDGNWSRPLQTSLCGLCSGTVWWKKRYIYIYIYIYNVM